MIISFFSKKSRNRGNMDILQEKTNKVRINTIHLEGDQSPHPTAWASIAPGGKRGQTYSELHQYFFTSLGIPFLANADLCRARVWLVLTREKGPPKEVLIHYKNQTLPNVPIGIRITGDRGQDWSSKPAMEEVIQHIVIGLGHSKTQTPIEGPIQPRMELARGAKQGQNWMYHSCPHPHRL
jgi:hypothetical protein